MKLTRRSWILAGAAIAVIAAAWALSPLHKVNHLSARLLGRSPVADGYVVKVGPAGEVLGAGTSVAPGERIGFALNAASSQEIIPTITGASGKVIATLPAAPVAPHAPQGDAPWLEGAGYPVAFSWTVPQSFPSGVYYLNGLPDIFLVVKPLPAPPPEVMVLMPTNTLNAYSTTLGRSLYKQPTMVTAVNFLRPQSIEKAAEWTGFLRWATERHPFGAASVGYIADADMDRKGALDGVKLLVVVGHSEYWTRAARQTFDAFIARGGNAIMAGGNDMWWQTRYSDDGKTMYVYRVAKTPDQGGDPIADPLLKTAYWHNKQLGYPTLPSIGGDFTYGGYGQRGKENGQFRSTMTIASDRSPLLAGLGVKDCEEIETPRSGEYDGAPIAGLDDAGRPVPNTAMIGASRFELIGFEWNHNGPRLMLGTMHVMQHATGSGYVLHMGGRGCCMGDEFYSGPGRGSAAIQAILRNAAALFLAGGDPFTHDAAQRAVAYPMTTPWLKALPEGAPSQCAPNEPDDPDSVRAESSDAN